MHHFVYILSIVVLAHSSFLQSIVVRHRAAFYTQERIDGKDFVHRVEILDGKQRNVWMVNGENVAEEVYEEEVLAAEMNERREERRNERKEQVADYFFKQEAHTSLLKKLLYHASKEIEEELVRLAQYNLSPYYVFSAETYATLQDFDDLSHQLVPDAQEALEQGDDIARMSEIYEQLQEHVDRLRQFVRATTLRAIEECDDTRVLKELLHVVS